MTFVPVIVGHTIYGAGAYGAGPYGDASVPDFCVEIDVTNDPTNPVRVWTDISPLIRQIGYSRSGRSNERQRTETGTLTALADNRDDAITSLGIGKRQWIRVRGRWGGVIYPRWQGIFESLPRQWPNAGHDAIIELHAADTLKVTRLYDLADETFAAQRNDERVSAILTLASILAGDIDTDTDPADAVVTPFGQGTDALQTLLTIEESENGLLLADPDGTISFQGRHWRLMNSSTALGTFGEDPDEIPYTDDATYEDDDQNIANIIGVDPNGGTTIVVEDAASKLRYFDTRLNRTLLTSDTTIAQSAAEYLLNRYKDPSPRIPAVTVQLRAAALRDPDMVATMLAAHNSDRFVWNRDATDPISDDVFVEQISETITPGVGWDMRLQLSPAEDENGWSLGDDTYSRLGQSTQLVY